MYFLHTKKSVIRVFDKKFKMKILSWNLSIQQIKTTKSNFIYLFIFIFLHYKDDNKRDENKEKEKMEYNQNPKEPNTGTTQRGL